MKKKYLQRGMSIIEIMIALGLMGVASYFLVSMLKNGFMGQKNLQSQDDARVLTDNIAQLLSDSVACENTFGGIPGTGNPVINPNTPGGVSVNSALDYLKNKQFVVGNVYGNRTLKLTGIVIGGNSTDKKTSIQQWTPGPAPPAPPTGMAFVQVNWQQTGTAANQSGPQQLSRYFMVYVATLDTAGNIRSCTAQMGGAGGSSYWTQISNFNIFNNNNNGMGYVGIGTTSPSLATLQTVGKVSATAALFDSGGQGIGIISTWPGIGFNSYYNGGYLAINTGYGGVISLNQSDGSMDFYTAANVSGQGTAQAQTERMRIGLTGNVGIGTSSPATRLDVNGPIRPQAATLGGGCSPIGAQAYNTATGEPIYCNGTNWTAVGGPAPCSGGKRSIHPLPWLSVT